MVNQDNNQNGKIDNGNGYEIVIKHNDNDYTYISYEEENWLKTTSRFINNDNCNKTIEYTANFNLPIEIPGLPNDLKIFKYAIISPNDEIIEVNHHDFTDVMENLNESTQPILLDNGTWIWENIIPKDVNNIFEDSVSRGFNEYNNNYISWKFFY